MKKLRFLALLFCAMISGVMLVACGPGNNPKAEFSKNEIVLSLDETVDFLQLVKSENLDRDKLEVEIVPSNLIDKVNDSYKAAQRGRGSVHIKYNGNLLSSCPLIVKQKYAAPQNIKVDENGVISWDKSSVYDDGKIVSASNYILKLDNEEISLTNQNSYTLEAAGSYDVQVKALGSDYIDASDYSELQILNYNVMPSAEIQRVELGAAFGGQNIRLYWQAVEHAKYNVEYNGFIISKGQSENYVNINCHGLKTGESANVIIEVCDTQENAMLSSRTRLNLKKLATPRLTYEDGKVVCENIVGVTSFMLQYITESGANGVQEVLPEDFNLNGIPSGPLQLNVQARGGVNYNEIYVNSDISNMEIYKLEEPSFYYELLPQGLQLKFNNQTYIKNYRIVYGDTTLEYNISEGSTLLLPISSFNQGACEVLVYSLPNYEDGEVLPFEEHEKVVISSPRRVRVYVLQEAQNISYTLNNKKITLTFDAVEYADNYSVTVNGSTFTEFALGTNKVNFEIDLSTVAPLAAKYNFDIKAFRKDNMAKESHSYYSLTVLDKAEKAEEQENGLFKWNAIAGAEYKYEIYSVDADFDETKDALSEPICSVDRTSDNVIAQTLDFGYYYIKVYTLSTSVEYLDSDFYDANNILKAKFHVEKRIDRPTFEFKQNGNDYSLTINKVDYAQKYSVYIDGVLEGDVYDNNPALSTLVYNFQNKFASAKKYEVSVEASAGVKYDSVIHTTSEKSSVNVTRLNKPTYSVSDQQYLTVESQPNSTGVVIKLGQDVLNTESEMGVDLSGYYGSFILSIQAKAEENSDEQYFLDSGEYLYSFKRVSAPSAISYNTGVLGFTSVDHELVDKYLITITLVNEINGDYQDVTTCKETSFNIAQYIQNKLLSTSTEDEMFKSAYQHCEAITISVSAYAFGEKRVSSENVFLLPSELGTTVSGEESLELRQLEKTNITFDSSTLTLSWTTAGDSQTRYSIYANGKLIKENLIGNSSSLDDVEFSSPTEIYVFAVNPSYLSSTNSNLIIVEKLAPVPTVNVDNSNSNVYFTVNTSKVEKVLNGETEISIASNGYVSIPLSGDTTLSLKLIAKSSALQGTTTYYYIDSENASYNFKDISLQELKLSLSDGLLTWNALGTDFTVEPNPLTYSIVIEGENGQGQVIDKLTVCQYNLDDEVLYKLSIGVYSLKVVTVINNYSIKGGADSIGYFSSKESNVMQLEKLKTIEKVSHRVIENQDFQKQTDKLVKANLEFKWKDLWSGTENLSFNIVINDTTSILSLKLSETYEKYSLTKNDDGEYVFVISQEFFVAGNNTITFVVNGDNSITSNVFTYQVYRYNNISSLMISDDGILEIKVNAEEDEGFNASNKIKNFMVGVTIGGVTTYQSFNSKSFNIMTEELLARGSGNYSVEVVGYDENGQFIATELVANLSGYRLNGINSASITPTGDIEIALYNENEIDENIRFVANYNGKIFTFNPSRIPNSATFKYSMEQFITLLNVQNFGAINFSISVQKQGAINADFVDLSFDYVQEMTSDILIFVRGRSYAEDYIKMPILSDVDTLAFRYEISYQSEDGVSHSIVSTYMADELRGFWITTDDGGYFVKEPPSGVDMSKAQECYALLVNDLASVIQKGNLKIRVSRVAMLDDRYLQYNYNEKVYTKLNSVNGISLRDDILSWNASTEPEALGYYVYIYYNNGQDFFDMVYTPSASLNLMTINFVPNRAYSLRIVTVSVNNNVLASNEVYNANSEITKYKAPASLQVVDGKIIFEENAVRGSALLTAIETAYNSTSLSKEQQLALINKSYSDIFTFSPSNISSLVLRLIFTREGFSYTARINPVQLLPDLSKMTFSINGGSGAMSYIAAIEGILNGAPTSSQNAIFVRQLLNEIKGRNGIATSEILFDSFASSVPAGQYTLSARQEGISRFRTITSEPSISIDVAVQEAPSITLSRNNVEGKNHYYLSFLSSMISPSKGGTPIKASSYMLVLKNEQNRYYFKINYLDSEYYLDSVEGTENQEDIGLKLATTTAGDKDSITIDFSQLLPLIKIAKGSYNMTVYTLGNTYSINSKTDNKTLTLLEISADSLALTNGVLSWRGTIGYNTQLIFKREGLAVNPPIEIASNNGTFVLNLENSGLYEYIILSILGSVGTNSMTIDSDSYKIENIVKLGAPNVQVSTKSFMITDSSSNNRYNPNVSFLITNNAYSGDSPFKTEPSSSKQFEYTAGANSQYNENEATEFYFASLGAQNIEFKLSDKEASDCDFILAPETDISYILLSSDYTTRKAQLLNQITSVSLTNGDFMWSKSETKMLSSDTTLIYKIRVEFYKAGQSQASASKEFYTESEEFDTLNIQDPDSNPYTYKLYITTLAMAEGTERNHDIVTIGGGYYSYASLTYDDGSYVLGSAQSQARVSAGTQYISTFEKAKDVTSFEIVEGAIKLTTDSTETLYWQFVDENGKHVATNSSTNSYSDFEASGIQPKFTFANNPYKLYVYNYSTDNSRFIKSNLIMLTLGNESNVYKLPSVEASDFEIVSGESSYRIDLSNLYNNKKLFETDSYYQVEMTVEITLENSPDVSVKVDTGKAGASPKQSMYLIISSDTRELSASGTTVTIPSIAKSIKVSFRTYSNESTQTRLFLNGDVTQFDITPLGFHERDTVSWNSTLNQFEWTLNEEKTQQCQFKITIGYADGASETAEVSEYCYQPKRMGTIKNVQILARKNDNALYSLNSLSITQDISYQLFAGGDGSVESPYIIATAAHFANMRYRNSGEYYFKQDRHLELSAIDFVFDEVFYGNYDGNNLNLTFISEMTDTDYVSQGFDLSQSFITTSTTNLSVDFRDASAVFKELARGSVVKNLKLYITNTRLIKYNTILSGLSLINRGRIENVTIMQVQNDISFAEGQEFALAECMLAAVNYGTIENAANNADIILNAMATTSNQIFIAPFVITNQSANLNNQAVMERCFNNGAISVTARRRNSQIRIAGIALNNVNGRISQCGNNARLEAVDTTLKGAYTSFIAGIALRFDGGELSYSYNKATLSSSAVTSNNIGGIAYALNSGRISSLVEASKNFIAYSCKSSVVNVTNSYYYSEYATANISAQEISERVIRCDSAYNLVITKVEGGFDVAIQSI